MRRTAVWTLLLLVLLTMSCGNRKHDVAYYEQMVDSIRRAEQVKDIQQKAGIYDNPIEAWFDTLHFHTLPIQSAAGDVDRRRENGILRPEQIEALKAQKNLENMQQYPVIQIMNAALPEPKVNGKVSLSERKLNKYFPSHMPSREREKVILELLAKWREEQEGMIDET